MTRAAVALELALLALGCGRITGDFDRVVALEIVGPFPVVVEVGDSVQLMARALTAAGDPAPDEIISWALLDIDSAGVIVDLDPVTGWLWGRQEGSQRAQARLDDLRSDPVAITVTPADTVVPPIADVRQPVGAPQAVWAPGDERRMGW